MTSDKAFRAFVERALSPPKAERYLALMGSKKGERRILDSLNHEFEPAIRHNITRSQDYSSVWEKPCYIFHSHEFGMPMASVREAYDRLGLMDGWLILLMDGSSGIFRPEGRWDAEALLK